MKIGIFIIIIYACVCFAADKPASKPYDTTYVHGIGGMLLLRTTPMLVNRELRITRYQELLETTGLTAEELIAYLQELRKDPDAGQALYNAMHNELSFKPDTTK